MRVPDRLRRRIADERGMFVVLMSLFMVGAMTVVAIVVDLGNLRAHRRTIQSEVDFAALAGAERLAYLDTRGACQEAMDYLRLNTPGLPAGTTVPCGDMPPTCDDDTPSTAVTDEGTAAPYRVTITYPVDDAAIHDPTVPGGIRKEDGIRCERLSVRVDRTTDGYFTGIVGVESMEIHARAVARRLPVQESRIPNLWLLDPHGCPALSVEGGSRLTVGTEFIGGLITIDSDGTASECSSTRWTIDASGDTTRIRVVPPDTDPPGAIALHALWPAQKRCDEPKPIGNPTACQQADFEGGEASARILPMAVRQPLRATRAIVDHAYDCKSSYPNYHGIRVVGCSEAGFRAPYITQLRTALKDAVAPPAGYLDYRASGYKCQNESAVLPAGNWWVDCATFKMTGGVVQFSGGNVVFTGSVDINGGSLRFNSPGPSAVLPESCHAPASMLDCLDDAGSDAAFVYLEGSLGSNAGAEMVANNVAVIQDGGHLDLAGGSTPVWSAPDAGPFTQLALWSETPSTKFGINGGALMQLEGVFFTPEANEFHLSGGGNFNPQRAQFVSYRLKISGGGKLTLHPTGSERIRVPPPAALLIR